MMMMMTTICWQTPSAHLVLHTCWCEKRVQGTVLGMRRPIEEAQAPRRQQAGIPHETQWPVPRQEDSIDLLAATPLAGVARGRRRFPRVRCYLNCRGDVLTPTGRGAAGPRGPRPCHAWLRGALR
ncbi:hypothetical protein CAOG_009479, partial [Capsaspora owczarzaki ATCC 30864]